MAPRNRHTRQEILERGHKLINERGLERVTIEALMRVVGLTNGGFYAHFDSKESMVAELLSASFVRARQKLLEGLESLSGSAFAKAVAQRYLSKLHRDNAALGCPAPATLSEIARSAEPTRKALTAAIEVYIASLERQLGSNPPAQRRERAIALLATCMGGLSLSRAVDDPRFSDEILRACAHAVADAQWFQDEEPEGGQRPGKAEN
jgi:TetR/AcrR family transcriptional repressor of nem operon